MTNNKRVADLLLHWRERRGRGERLTPEELCKEDPDLLDIVRQQLPHVTSSNGFQSAGMSISTIEVTNDSESTRHGSDATSSASSVPVPSFPGYQVTSEIARGGMGRVYAGLDLKLEREVAIKTLLPGADVERFITESKITARLPHPNIPPVYDLETLDDGSPYLVMKLVRGKTLADLLRERVSEQGDWPHLTQVFEQIAQAVGFAHSRGIIHRDLKPANVMVGEFGEVQIMDWGLAKDQTSREHARLNKVGPADEQHTSAGTVLGTPGYMSPEQARGEVVDERADVFSLGAVLAEILTGRPAVVGANAQEIILKAARADLADGLERLDTCGADAELIALAKRCLSADSRDRQATGRAVADEMSAYRARVEARMRQAEAEHATATLRSGEQRKRRRQFNIAVAVVAATLLIGLAASLWQMNVARHERDARQAALTIEKKARKQAFDALRSMTDEVIQRRFAAGQGYKLTDEDRAFLRSVIAQYEAFAAIHEDDVESRSVQAEGRDRVGHIRAHLNELELAQADYDVAIAIRSQLVAELPNRLDHQRPLASTYLNRGSLLRQRYRFKEALADFDAAMGILKQLVTNKPADADFRAGLATSHQNRGAVLQDLDQLDAAMVESAAALSLRRQLVADFPTNAQFREALALSHNNRGLLFNNAGRKADAVSDYGVALGIQMELVKDFPSTPKYRNDLAQSYNNRGGVLQLAGRFKEAATDYDDAVGLYRQLAADFPTRPEYRRDLAMSLSNRGMLGKDSDQPAQAETDFDAALEIRKRLAADFPDQTGYREELAENYMNRGLLRSETRRDQEAKADYDLALFVYKGLMAAFPDKVEYRHKFAGMCVNFALLQFKNSPDWNEAQRWLLLGQSHHEYCLSVNPTNPQYRQYYRNHLSVLTMVQAGLLAPEDAVRTAETRRDLGWNAADDAFDAASTLSKCLSVVAKHSKLDDQERRSALRFYADEAMKYLSHAKSKGFRRASQLKQAREFFPLKTREDFQKLLAELEADEN